MSTAHDAHGDAPHAHDAAHAHDEFDPEPTQELSPGEPRTPLWLPAVGAVFFLLGTVVFLLSGPGNAAEAEHGQAAAQAVPTIVAQPAPPPAAAPAPNGNTQAADVAKHLQQLTPEQKAELQKRLQDLRDQMKNRPAPVPAPTPR